MPPGSPCGIVGGGVVDEVLAEARREEVGEEGGLENATLAHENQDVLVHHLDVTHATTIATSHFLKK